MTIKRKPIVLRPLFIVLAAIVLFSGAIVLWLILFPTKPSPMYPVVPTQDTPSNVSSNKNEGNPTNKSPASNLPETSQQVPSSSSGTIVISTLNQANGYINVSSYTRDFNEETCVFTFTSSGARPIVKQLPKCQAFSLQETEFEKIGLYTLTVVAYSSTEKISASSTLEVH